MSGRLITFSGSDCSGKSTQLRLLSDELERRGERPISFWFRPGHSSLLDAARRTVRRVRPSALPGPGQARARERAFARPLVKHTWIAMALLDMLLQYGVVLRTHLGRGRIVLCDRYLADARLDFALRFPELYPRIEKWLNACEAVLPRPRHAFLISVPDAELIRRASVKVEPFADPPELRQRRNRAYDELAKHGSFLVLDGTRPEVDLHEDVLRTVSTEIGSG
jgi:thymidylate kinase